MWDYYITAWIEAFTPKRCEGQKPRCFWYVWNSGRKEWGGGDGDCIILSRGEGFVSLLVWHRRRSAEARREEWGQKGRTKKGCGHSSVGGRASDWHATNAGLTLRWGKGFFSQSQLSVQTLLQWSEMNVVCLNYHATVYTYRQDSYRSRKPGKVLEFGNAKFQALKGLGIFKSW